MISIFFKVEQVYTAGNFPYKGREIICFCDDINLIFKVITSKSSYLVDNSSGFLQEFAKVVELFLVFYFVYFPSEFFCIMGREGEKIPLDFQYFCLDDLRVFYNHISYRGNYGKSCI